MKASLSAALVAGVLGVLLLELAAFAPALAQQSLSLSNGPRIAQARQVLDDGEAAYKARDVRRGVALTRQAIAELEGLRPQTSETQALRARGHSFLSGAYYDASILRGAVAEAVRVIVLLDSAQREPELLRESLKNAMLMLDTLGRPVEALEYASRLLELSSAPDRDAVGRAFSRVIEHAKDSARRNGWDARARAALRSAHGVALKPAVSLTRPMLPIRMSGILGEALAANREYGEAADLFVLSTRMLWPRIVPQLWRITSWDVEETLREMIRWVPQTYTLTLERHAAPPELGLEMALLAKGLYSEVERSHHGVTFSDDPSVADSVRRLRELRRRLARNVEEYEQEGQKPLEARADSLRSLELWFMRRAAGGYPEVVPAVTIPDLQQRLGRRDVLLEFVRYIPIAYPRLDTARSRYGVFVVPGSGRAVHAIDLGLAAEVDSVIARLRQAQQAFTMREEDYASTALALRRRVLDPVWAALGIGGGEGPRRLYVSADGDLTLVAFETLPAMRAGSRGFLLEECEIVYLNAARDLVRFSVPASRRAGPEVVLVGDPAFDATPSARLSILRNERPDLRVQNEPPVAAPPQVAQAAATRRWEPLPSLGAFVDSIAVQARTYGLSARVLKGNAASEEMLQETRSPRLLLLASHGKFVEDSASAMGIPFTITGDMKYAAAFIYVLDPMFRSYFVLAGANDRSERVGASFGASGRVPFQVGDGLLTAFETRSLDLRDSELVILIGCETAVGVTITGGGRPIAPGEATSGMRQALYVAGARSVVLSLWPVTDRASTFQMGAFLDDWFRGTSRYQAFRASQLAALKHARETRLTSHPYWWGAFIYTGDPGDIAARALR